MANWMSRLRTWLLVRLGLWRRQWRRGRITVRGAAVFGQLPVRSWSYGLYSPAGLADDQSAPLIVLLHGCKQRALGFAYASGWTDFADRRRVRLLCPDQRRMANLFRCWNWFHPSAQRGQGELDVITAMIDDVAGRVKVEANGVAAVGVSAGAALVALLAFHRAERFKAAIVVAGLPLLGNLGIQSPQAVMRRGLSFTPALALSTTRSPCAPLAVIHGMADQIVHPRCSEQLVEQAIEVNRRAGVKAQKGSAPTSQPPTVDYRANENLILRTIEVPELGHVWTGGPGGHPFCEHGGPPLVSLCENFLRDVALIR
jgi:poly(hydroxyalkanoate) depolymerase family esterase